MFASNINLSHPKLPLYTNRLKHTVDLALIKAIAHHKNASQNPLPTDPKSLERAFYNVFKAIPKRKQDDAAERFQNVMTAAQRTSVYGDLGQVNFASPVSVIEQVKALALPANMLFSEADVASLRQQLEANAALKAALKQFGQNVVQAVGQGAAAGRAYRERPVPRAVVANKIDFSVVSATCINPNDIRKDETNLAVATADGLGAPLSAGPFFVGDFKKGQTIDLGAAGQLFSFETGAVFPVSLPVCIFMVESDLIHNADLVRKLSIALSIATAALTAASITLIVLGLTGVVPVPAAIIGIVATMVASLVTGFTTNFVLPLLADDVSECATEVLILDRPVDPGTSFDRTLVVGGFGRYGRGDYNVQLRWTAVG